MKGIPTRISESPKLIIKKIKMGNVSCEIEFETPPVNPLQLMIYTTHRKKLTIDALRTLKFDY